MSVDRESDIFRAIKNSEINKVEELIAAGINLNIQDNIGNTPLMYASMIGNRVINAILINAGADLNTQNNHGCTSLMFAVSRKNLVAVEVLAYKGADIFIKNNVGHTALQMAIYNRHLDIAEFLISFGYELKQKGHKYSDYVIKMIIENAKTCPICYNDLDLENIHLGKNCDHPVCCECWSQIVKCPICRNEKF